jgi:tripartite-type tricarboxylate transporter receptor subunit TctC
MKSLLIGVLAAALTQSAFAQSDYPNKPVRIIVPFGAGGAADTLPRLVGAKLAEMWGQAVIVENRTGAAGNIGMEAGSKAAPDGYTLTSAPVGNLAINPHLYPRLGFDVFRDFTPITLVASVQNVLVVHPSVKANTLSELVSLAREKAGGVTFASGGNGTQAHVGVEILKAQANIDVTHVAYKGVGDAVKDLLGGQTSMMLAQVPAVTALVKSGKLRALAVANAKRSAALPDVPTFAEAGTALEAVSWYALIGPAGVPAPIVAKIQSDVAKALQMPDVREKLLGLGAEPVGSTPEQLRAAMRTDFDRYGAVIKRIGIKAE